MNKLLYTFGCFLLVSISLSIGAQVYATVGGPTYIGQLRYNSQDQSVYYIKHSSDGRGCPPELIKLSLITGKNETVFSCTDGEKLSTNYDAGRSALTEINKIIADYKYLSQINLETNNINIDVNHLNDEKFNPQDEYIKNANFIASVYQGETKLADLPITGCNKEQPFTFAGYTIPGLNKKIVLLLSTKSDCFEGGYIGESLYVIGNIDNLNRNSNANAYKDNSALSPNEGTLVIFEPDKIKSEITNTTNEDRPSLSLFKYDLELYKVIIIALISIFIGIILGRSFTFRK
jgi:hypothetical protein